MVVNAAEPVWFAPESHAARRDTLRIRARALRAIRCFFEERGVIEVETPALQVSPGLEPHLRAFETRFEPVLNDQPDQTFFLHTSPEFAMKKLLAAGERDIFQIARVFRNGETSETHHPEFTMLEWYRTGYSLQSLMDETEALIRHTARATGIDRLTWAGRCIDPAVPWQRLSVAGAFGLYAGVDLMAALELGVSRSGDPMEPDATSLASEAERLGIGASPEDRFEDMFFRIFLALIEPKLGRERPTILHGYPLCMGALAKASSKDARLSERFEVYVGGLELANAFEELTDPIEQRRRFEHDMAVKDRLYGTRYPIDDGFIMALERGLAPCSGIALGIDRLIMLLTGATDIRQVLWAPVETDREPL